MKRRIEIAKGARKQPSHFARIEDAVAAIRAGKMVIVVDDEDRENEGDLTIAAEKVTPEAINFMARHGRGLICLSMTPERLDELEIPLMVSQNTSRFETAFCVPIEAKGRTTTGISAADRAMTALTAIDPATKPSDLAQARPHVSAAVAHRRRHGPRRTDRGRRRSRADCRAVPGGRHLRGHERRRHDGTRAAAREVRQETRAAAHHDRRLDQVPDPQRAAASSASPRRGCPRSTGRFRFTRSKTCWTSRPTSRSCRATSPTG